MKNIAQWRDLKNCRLLLNFHFLILFRRSFHVYENRIWLGFGNAKLPRVERGEAVDSVSVAKRYCMSVVLASFAIPLWGTPQAKALMEDKHVPNDVLSYVLLFFFYFVNYFVIVFFNSALIACVIHRFRGGTPSISLGCKSPLPERRRLPAGPWSAPRSAWCLGSSSPDRKRLEQLVAGLLGMAWAIVTYLVVPVLVMEKAEPNRSGQTLDRLAEKDLGRGAKRAHQHRGDLLRGLPCGIGSIGYCVGLGVYGVSAGHVILGGIALTVAVVILIPSP